MKIVLALAPVWDSVTPPLTLAYMKSSISEAGYACKAIDLSTQFRSLMVSALGDLAAEDYIENHPELYQNWAEQICKENPDVVGFTILISNIKNTAIVAKEIKRRNPEILIVSGGPSLTLGDKHHIEHAYTFSDHIIEGEGEKAFVDFLKGYEQGEDLKKLKQLWIKEPDNSIYYTGTAPLQDIDSIPLPDFNDFDRKSYIFPDRLPILFSRGCILNCNYCTNKWNHLTQRSRSGQLVFEELKRNVLEYGIKEYMFNDDSLISYKTFNELEKFCDLAISEDLILPWSVYGTRIERKLTEDYIRKLRRSGMMQVSLGVESFSTRVQKEMGKSSKEDDCDRVCRMFADQGIKTETWIIYGYPTETDEDFEVTLNWFKNNPNVLSHATINAFGPNQKYFEDRPNVVHYYPPYKLWHWKGLESTVEKRKERFLKLIEVVEEIRLSHKGFSYFMGDPLYVKYFNSWNEQDKRFLFDSWAKLESSYSLAG